jgi:hypothetical protein
MDPSQIILKKLNEIEDDEVTDQIAIRRYLTRKLDGDLYPKILNNEIDILIKRQEMEE